MKILKRGNILFIALIVALIFALIGVVPRYTAEKNNNTVAFVSEYKDVISLATQENKSAQEVWSKLNKEGMAGITISEYSGEELIFQEPLHLQYGSAKDLGINNKDVIPSRATVIIEQSYSYSKMLSEYIKIKIPSTVIYERDGKIVMLLPGTLEEFRSSSFIPDFEGLNFCKSNSIVALFRPGPCNLSSGKEVATALEYLISEYPQIKNILPSGFIMAGYPDLAPIVDVIKKNGLTLSQVEFVKQIGVGQLAVKMKQDILPLHSLTKEEIISKRLSQTEIWDRYVRAVHERSVRLIILRPYDLQMGNRYDSLLRDMSVMRTILTEKGYQLGWPSPLPYWPAPVAGAVACAIVFVFCGWSYFIRFTGKNNDFVSVFELIALVLSAVFLSGMLFKLSIVAKILGGFCGALVATEATILALELFKKRWLGALMGLFVVVVGGLSIASFYGTMSAALRLTPFSGVKLTLLLPPVFLILHDFKLRIHPESLSEVLERPAIWGELVLMGVMMLGLLIIALRSDNVSNVPALEVAFRNFIEKVLLIRPRTKEFMIGYPALVLYWYLVRNGLALRYREVVRVATSLAFCSAVNTFCHFHTFIKISLIRVFNGWWLGLLIGLCLVLFVHFIIVPLFKKTEERCLIEQE